ncbi:MAG: hypothetical protein JO166_04255 [Deltaproteobacteria bacterium]|nr:hypothetical protein [Deltaproteobacteria bacterium]
MLRYAAGAAIILVLAIAASAQRPEDITADADLETARQVKDYYGDWLSSIPGVSKVTVANSARGEPEIMVEVSENTPQIKTIPQKFNGIPVVVAPLKQAAGELSSEPPSARGYMPSPTPEVQISPVPTPQGNKFMENPYPNAYPQGRAS